MADLHAVPTPALVVDMETARRNHRLAVASLGRGQVLRLHFKAHKCSALLALQLERGPSLACCQTSWEALVLAEAGVGDIMLTNQLADQRSLDELVAAAKRAHVSVLVDHAQHVRLLETAASQAGVTIDVLIEVDLGMKRCGVAPGSADLLDLAAAIASSRSLGFAGIQAYDGHVAGIVDPAGRRAAAAVSAELTRQAVVRLRTAGFAVPIVAGCATGHLPFAAELEVWTDIQAGSYLLMDGAYGDCPDLPFDTALFALATVIHRSADRIVLDIGLKQLAVDRGNPTWIGDAQATLRLSDEHTVIALRSPCDLAVGDRTLVRPRHVDPTVNLHPALWLREQGSVRPVAIDGRMPIRPLAPSGTHL